MTAVLAAARVVLCAVLVLTFADAVFRAAFGPQDWRAAAWLGVMCVVVTGCVVALGWLGNRRRKEARDG